MVGTRRRRAAVLGALVLLASLLQTLPTALADEPAEPTVVFEGGGFGHGIGLSQYGARAQGLAGRTPGEIVTHYYPGTEVAVTADLPIPEAEFNQPIWVGLMQNLAVAELSWTDAAGMLCIDPDPSNEAKPCARRVDVRVGEQFRVEWDAETDLCMLTRIKASGVEVLLTKTAPDCRMSATVDTGGTLWFGGFGYAAGSIELRRAPNVEAFHVAAVLDLETYVSGLDEMPSHWNAAALEAQTLASRSFGLNRYLAFEDPSRRTPGDAGLSETAKGLCWCHVYDDTRSQVYEGVAATTPERIAAATATIGQVVAYFGTDSSSFTRSNVIEAYFSSSNAGVTLSNVIGFGSTRQYPYLIPVDDPWSIAESSGNPYATWTLERSPDFIADRLGWDELRGVWMVGSDPAVVHFDGIDAGQLVSSEYSGDALRGAANLLSGQVAGVRLEGVPSCSGYLATIWGTKHADVLEGTSGHDVIVGLGGSDVIDGRGGHDVICGNGGDDTIDGKNGSDRLFGGNGADTVLGGGGHDALGGGDGADTLDGGNGSDTLDGDKGLDVLIGGAGRDRLRGGPGADVINGNAGSDDLFGNAGADVLSGGDHNDALRGGPGADSLDGGGGTNDQCRGGTGIDEVTAACEIVYSVP